MRHTLLSLILGGTILALAPACGDSAKAHDDAAPRTIDAAVNPADAGTPDASCYTDPTTTFEIMNACTDAQKIEKHPVLPHLNPDGTLPGLPQ